MKSYNFCPECGKSLENDSNICPNCGFKIISELKEHASTINEQIRREPVLIPKITQKAKPLKKRMGFLSWILLIIGAIIGLYALFTPAGTIKVGDIFSWDMWMFGYNRVYDWEVGLDTFWTLNEDLLGVSIVSTIFVIVGNILAVVSAGSLIIKGNHTSYLAIIAPVILIGSALFYLAAYQVLMFFSTGESFWSLINPSFAIWGQFLAAVIMVSGFFISRSSPEYIKPLDKELHQEKVYNMLKTIIKTKNLQEHEKSNLEKELELISLRLKGVALLKRKIESLIREKQVYMRLEESEYEEALKYFQHALDLSSTSQYEILKNDLYLVNKIIEQQDTRIALNYLEEISNHTTILLGEILKKISFKGRSKL